MSVSKEAVRELQRRIFELPKENGLLNELDVAGTIAQWRDEYHWCDLPDDHEGDCWYESGTPDD